MTVFLSFGQPLMRALIVISILLVGLGALALGADAALSLLVALGLGAVALRAAFWAVPAEVR